MSKIVLAVLIGGLVAFGVGCGQEGLPAGKSPEDVIKEALLNQQDITKSVYEININADIKGDVDGEKNELKGWAKVSGTSNADEMENQFVLSIDGKMNTEAVKADLEARGNKDGLFIKIGKLELSDKDSQAMIDMFIGDYKGKWTLLSFATANDADVTGYATIDYSEGDPIFLKDIEYKGTKDVLGLKSYVFAGKVDPEALAETMDASQVEEMEMFFEKGEVTGEIYTAVNEKVWTGMSLNLKMSDKEMNGTASLSFLLNPTKSNKVETPKHEKEITEEDMVGLFGGGMAPTEYDMDYDYDYDADLEMMDYDFESMEDFENLPVE